MDRRSPEPPAVGALEAGRRQRRLLSSAAGDDWVGHGATVAVVAGVLSVEVKAQLQRRLRALAAAGHHQGGAVARLAYLVKPFAQAERRLRARDGGGGTAGSPQHDDGNGDGSMFSAAPPADWISEAAFVHELRRVSGLDPTALPADQIAAVFGALDPGQSGHITPEQLGHLVWPARYPPRPLCPLSRPPSPAAFALGGSSAEEPVKGGGEELQPPDRGSGWEEPAPTSSPLPWAAVDDESDEWELELRPPPGHQPVGHQPLGGGSQQPVVGQFGGRSVSGEGRGLSGGTVPFSAVTHAVTGWRQSHEPQSPAARPYAGMPSSPPGMPLGSSMRLELVPPLPADPDYGDVVAAVAASARKEAAGPAAEQAVLAARAADAAGALQQMEQGSWFILVCFPLDVLQETPSDLRFARCEKFVECLRLQHKRQGRARPHRRFFWLENAEGEAHEAAGGGGPSGGPGGGGPVVHWHQKQPSEAGGGAVVGASKRARVSGVAAGIPAVACE